MKKWKIEYSANATRTLKKLDKTIRRQIENFVVRLNDYPSPRSVGKALSGVYSGQWRYRVGDYRIICFIHDNVMTIEIFKIGHRSEVYKN